MNRFGMTGVCLAGLALCSPPGRASEGAFKPPDVSPLRRLKKLYPRTVLVQNGRPRAFIVIPEDQTYAVLAGRLRDTIRRAAGAALDVRRASELVDEDWQIDHRRTGARNMIALGNVNSNRLLAVLYGERYVVADSIYPGAGGYVVRTVHDPWATGVNVLVLAGSDAAGVEKAVSVFAEKYAKGNGTTLSLRQPVIDVEFEKKAYRFFPAPPSSLGSKRQPQYTGMDWFRTELRRAGLMDGQGNIIRHENENANLLAVTGWMARIGQTYFRTGEEKLLPLMRDLVRKNRALLKNPANLHGMGGRSAGHVKQWDLLEELPIWTDRDRLDITNALLMDAALGHERRDFHGKLKQGFVQVLDENHGTFSAQRSFQAWQYFHKYYDVPASRYWMKCADAVFSAQASTFQILEDASGYLCYCPNSTMDYGLRRGDLTYFRRGIALHHARYISLACINNLGLSTGFGDSPSLLLPAVFENLAPAAWFHSDARLYWIIHNKLPQPCGLRVFQNSIAVNLEVEPKEPTEWTGLIRIPLYESPLTKGRGAMQPVFAPKKDVDPKLFNKIVFKENWDEDGQYLLLDGAGVWGSQPGPHGHKHNDINTIVNFTDEGRMWLVDHSYDQRAFQDHSGVFLAREGAGGYRKRTLACLENLAENEAYGMTRSTFGNWERSIFWKKGRYFLVIDRVAADRDGDYFARCTFKTLGRETLRGTDLYLEQRGRFCKIVSDGGAGVEVEESPFRQQAEWKRHYSYAEPVAKMFLQDKVRPLGKGEGIAFLNLIYAYASKDQEDRVTMRPVSDTCALVLEEGTRTIVGTGEIPGGLGPADMFVISKDAVFTADEDIQLDARQIAGALAAAEALAERRRLHDRPSERASREPEVHGLKTRTVELGRPVSSMLAADLDGDGAEEWLVGGPAGLCLYTSDGEKRWTCTTGADVRALDVADLDGDGRLEVVFGCDDEKVRALDGSGRELWSFTCKGSDRGGYGRPAVDYVKVADLEGDGKTEVVVGAHWVHVLSGKGRLKWEQFMDFRRGRVAGDFVAGVVVDVNGDGRLDITAAFRTSYSVVRVMDAEGGVLMPSDYRGVKVDKSPRDWHGGVNVDVPVDVTAFDLNGDGRTHQVVCATKSCLRILWHDQKRREDGGGLVRGPFTGVCIARAGRAAPPIIVAANGIYGVLGVEARPKKDSRRIKTRTLWYRTLDAKITALAAADLDADGTDEVYVGTRTGNVYVFDAGGGGEIGVARSRRLEKKPAPVAVLAPTFQGSDPKTGAVLAARSDGTVIVIGR